MSKRRWLRITLAAIYAAALLSVDLAHDRHGGSEEPRAECLASCADAGLHLTSHPAPDLSAAHAECHACLLHAAPALLPESTGFAGGPVAGKVIAASWGAPGRPACLVPRGRGPPLRF